MKSGPVVASRVPRTAPHKGGPLAVAAVLGLLVAGSGCGPEGFVDRSLPQVSDPPESSEQPRVGTAPPVDAPREADGPTSGPPGRAQVPPDGAADPEAPSPRDAGLPSDGFPAAADQAPASAEGAADPPTASVAPVDAAAVDATAAGAGAAAPGDPALPPAGPDGLVVRSAPGRALTDLTGLRAEDWIHWALAGAADTTRKRAVPARIGWSLLGTPRVGRYDDRATGFTWSDGTPTRMARTRAGAVVGGGVGLGFRLLVSGPTGRSRLTLHLGAWNTRADLRVRVERPGAEEALPSSEQVGFLDVEQPGRDRIVSVDFGPLPSGQELAVEWTVGALHHPQGNVTLQAATLSAAVEAPGAEDPAR